MPQISGEECTYSELTQTVMSIIDGRLEPDISGSSSERLPIFLRQNKLSTEFLEQTHIDSPGSLKHREHREYRSKRMSRVCSHLNDAKVDYASMKNLRTPMALMSDIDLLIPNPSDQAKASRVLAREDFDFYRFRLLAHPRKVMAKKSDADPRPVDIYPDAMWIRKVVCNAEAVVERAAETGERTPAPADDLYLVATHAYSHLSVTLAELFHGVRVLEEAENFDWYIVLESAKSYGCLDGVFAYLLLLDEYLAATDRERIPDFVFDSIPNTWAVRLVRRWWVQGRPRSFPIKLPTWLPTIVSSFHHVPRAASELTPHETWKDLQSHYLAAASQLLLGEA